MTKIVFVGTRVSDLSNSWAVSGNNIYSNYSGNVGVGTSTPTTKLDVSGAARVTGNTTICGTLFVNDIQGFTGSQWTTSGNNISYTTGNVGVGKDASSNNVALDVSGDINFSGSLYQNGVLFTSGGGGGGSSQWTTAGSEIYYQGNVGIGTGMVNPAYTLDVSGNINATTIYANSIQSGSDIVIDISNIDGLVQFGSNTLVVDPALNRVGLGTSTPSMLLDVNGNANIGGDATIGGKLYVDEIAFAGDTVFDLSGSDDYIQFGENNTMFVDISQSRVGIGMTNPSCTLDVNGTIRATDIQFASSNINIDTTEVNASLSFGTNNTLHVNPVSNCVGIGTTLAATRLQVNQSVASWYPSYNVSNASMTVYGAAGSNPVSTTSSTGAALNSTMSLVSTSSYGRNSGSSLAFCGRAYNYSGSFIHMPFARITGTQQSARDDYGGDLVFEVNGNNQYTFHEVMRVTASKYVGIGTTAPGYPLEIVGPSVSQSSGVGVRYFNYSTALTQSAGGITSGTGFSIVTSGTIWSKDGIAASSDQRIKTNIQDLDDQECLSMINAIQPKKYEYIDKAKKTDKLVYGFIAQQIKEVLPHAVSLQTEYIPNVFCMADVLDNVITIVDPSGEKDLNQLLVPGCKVKLYDSNDNQHIVKVIEVLSSTSFSFTSETTLTDEQYFVYGREVSNFHSLNKDYIFTLNVCATQELSRKVDSLTSQVGTLTSQVEQLTTENTELKSENALLKQRIDQICAHLGLTL